MIDKTAKSRWGIGIAVVYGAFMLAMIAIVIASRFQTTDLVSRDYYDKGIKFQDHIDRMKRSAAGDLRLAINHDAANGVLSVQFPEDVDTAAVSGKLKLFRPSNAALDRNFDIKVKGASAQRFECGRLARGLWKIKVDWQVDTLQYYYEQELYVN